MFVLKNKNLLRMSLKVGFLTHFIFSYLQQVSLGAINKQDLKQGELYSTWAERMNERYKELRKLS